MPRASMLIVALAITAVLGGQTSKDIDELENFLSEDYSEADGEMRELVEGSYAGSYVKPEPTDPTPPPKATKPPSPAPVDDKNSTKPPSPAPVDPAPPPSPDSTPPPGPTDPEKPVFNASDFDVNDMNVVTYTFSPDSTLPPTPAPAPPPAGKKYVTKTVEKKAVKVKIAFPFSEAELEDPLIQLSLRQGFAASLGLDAKSVLIAKIGSKAVSGRRLADTEVEFNVISSSADTSKLEANIKAAATEGSIVANIQKAADNNKVLTQALLDMPRVLPEPTVTSTTVTVTETVLEDAPAEPTPAPTEALGGASATSMSSICLALVLVQSAMMAFN